MKISKKQREFFNQYGYYLDLKNGDVVKVNPYKDTCVKASKHELVLYRNFEVKKSFTLKSEFKWLSSILSEVKERYQIFKCKVTADIKSRKYSGRTYWVLKFPDNQFRAVNRSQINYFKQNGMLRKNISFIDIDNECYYCTKRSQLNDKK